MQPIVTPKKWSDYSQEELLRVMDSEPGHGANHLAASHHLTHRQLTDVASILKRSEELAVKLDRQTAALIIFTRGLFVLTFVLAAIGAIQVWVMLEEHLSKTH